MQEWIIIVSIILVALTWAYILWDLFKDINICDKCYHRMYVEGIEDSPYYETRIYKCPYCGYKKKILKPKSNV